MYKYITLLIIFVLCFVEVEGQVMQGDKYLSGSIMFAHSRDENNDPSNFGSNNDPSTNLRINFSPQVGFLVSDFMAIGVQLNYRIHKRKQQFFSTFGGSYINQFEEKSIGIAPFTKVYWKLAKQAGFTLNVSTGVGFGKHKSNDLNSVQDVKRNVFELNFDVEPRFYYFITSRIGVEASFGGLLYQYKQYRGIDNIDGIEINQSNFSSSFGSGLALSFNYYFGKRFGKKKEVTSEN